MRTLLVAALVLAVAPDAPAALVGAVFGGRVPCTERDGVQFCEGGIGMRVESWDGVPLDVNVTLPPAALDGPFPLIVDLHGWSIGKATAPFVARALAGYVVVAYSARGFHQSCGLPASRAADPALADPDACATRGWTHLADARYEARDTQWLAGLLADEGLVAPDRIGVTGTSYGGGQSLILAALRNRVMLPDGTLVPWKSPGGLDLTIAAGAPLIPWSDLSEALTPAGRTLDYRVENPYGSRAGVQKESWVQLLYAIGAGSGFYAPPGADPSADLAGWNARLAAGEPYDQDPTLLAALDEVSRHHSGYYVDDGIPPAPLFIYNAWTDDLFPADEALRFVRRTRARHPGAEIALHLADTFGHPRAGLDADLSRVSSRVDAFFARHLQGTGEALPAVEAWTQGCGVPEQGPFTAADWDAIHPGEVRFAARKPRVLDSAGGSAEVAAGLNPIGGGPCRTFAAADDPGAATWRVPAATGGGYTLVGAPTVIAAITASGSFAQLVARLWDVAPDGTQTLVSQQPYRPRTDNLGPQPFQLHANGWHFAAGHAPKLELVGRSVPFVRASNGAFRVTVRNLELRLPVLQPPDGARIETPAPPVLPPDAVEPPDAGVPACGEAPAATCATGTGKLRLRGGGLVWAWRGTAAAAELGDPRGTTGYRLCLYDGAALLASPGAAAGEQCGHGRGARPCWKRRGAAFAYGSAAAPDGLRQLALKPSRRAERSAFGARTTATGGVVAGASVRVQLRNGLGGCWESVQAVR